MNTTDPVSIAQGVALIEDCLEVQKNYEPALMLKVPL